MPVRSQLQIAEQMVAQIRLLEPSISAEVGTPERLILDTVSGAIAEDSIDLIGLQQALNVDTKFGVNLTNFLSIFGFARQEAAKANGYVIFSLITPSNRTIQIPKSTILKAQTATTLEGEIPEFETTAAAFIRPGETESGPVPIECTRPGSFGNVEANKITVFLNPSIGPLLGVTSVTNPAPTTHGTDQEGDDSLKVRFKNTVFRNMAGTQDQFLALSIATAFTTKANVVGPVSKYQEYVQVPQDEEEGHTLEGDDTVAIRFGGEGSAAYVGYPAPIVVRGSSVLGSKIVEVTSTTGAAKGDAITVYEEGDNPRPSTVTKVAAILTSTTLELEIAAAATANDAWVTIGTTSSSPFVNKWTSGLSTNPFAKTVFPELSVFISTEASGISKRFFREGADFNFNFPPKLQGDTYRAMIDGTGNDPRVGEGSKQPNVTFINVYQGSEPTAVAALAPGTVALLEYSYTSQASRNDPEHNVTNAVDVFIDGANKQQTSTVFAVPVAPKDFEFKDDPVSKFYYENYRRAGEPATRPVTGNILTQLFNQPVLNIPEQITVGTNVYYRNIHYWLVRDVSTQGGTIRARDGIEWSGTLAGDNKGEKGRPSKTEIEKQEEGPVYTGLKFAELAPGALIDLQNYIYDQNVPDLQAALEGSRQITTDVLAHSARKRHFKLDVTVVYAATQSVATVNENIEQAISRFFSNQFFGSVIRLSDLLQQIHNVAGVENVRWSNDVPHTRDLIRVFETDIGGQPLRGVFTERVQTGVSKPVDQLYIVGNPTEGQFGLKYDHSVAPTLAVASLTAKQLETKLNTLWLPAAWSAVVTEDTRSTVNVRSPIRSFRIVYNKEQRIVLPEVVYNHEALFQGGEFTYDFDYFLHDDELPALPTGKQTGDTVPGLIIRARAQNVFQKA